MTDKEITEGILKGEQRAFKALVDKYQPLVLNTCNSFLHNTQDAEDVTQEVFITAFKSLQNFRGQSSLSTWLYRIAVNKSLNHIRDNRKRNIVSGFRNILNVQENDSKIPVENPSEQYNVDEAQNERIELLHKSIRLLPEKQKIAFTLNKFEELSYKLIAEIMGLSLSAVESLMHRAKHNVQKRILAHYQKKNK